SPRRRAVAELKPASEVGELPPVCRLSTASSRGRIEAFTGGGNATVRCCVSPRRRAVAELKRGRGDRLGQADRRVSPRRRAVAESPRAAARSGRRGAPPARQGVEPWPT